LIFLGIAAFIAIIIAWFAILFTGRFPRGLFEFVAGYLRWTMRVTVYCGNLGYNPYLGGLLRDEYPPFSLKGDPTSAVAPSSPRAGADFPSTTADEATAPLSYPPSPPRMDPDEMALARLSDLRAKNLITDAEYQEKRKAIIDRL
jgi:Domain of unknown function (DUF4389)/Short C-terminal domain